MCLCPYLVLVGFFQRLDFFLVLVVLGVESINDLQEENGISSTCQPLHHQIDSSTGKSKAQFCIQTATKSIPITSERRR